MNRHSGLIIVLACVVVMGSLVVRHSIGQTDSQPTVQRWVYKVVNLAEIEMNAKGGQNTKDAIETQFNALGEEGWSLAKLDRAIAVFEKSSK
jgi:hypothetical protein